MRRLLLIAALALAGCTGKIAMPNTGGGGGSGNTGGGSGGGSGGGDAGIPCAPANHNDEIRLAMNTGCSGCHTVGNHPFFASLDSFENGLVYNIKYVTPGDPDNSYLIQLIEGMAQGSYKQMPPGETYATLLGDGRATLTVDQLKDWIRNLPPAPTRLAGPSLEHFAVRRLTAEEMTLSLLDQLGLTVEDFIDTSDSNWRDQEYTVNGGKLFVWPGDWAPGISQQYVSDSSTVDRFEALGGPSTLFYRKRDVQLGPSAMQTLVQVSQAWCQRAVDKQGNTAVLRYVTLADTSASKADAIKQNISALWLRMLGQPATIDDVDGLYTDVYLHYESTDTRTAWTAVCAALVRNPLWLTY